MEAGPVGLESLRKQGWDGMGSLSSGDLRVSSKGSKHLVAFAWRSFSPSCGESGERLAGQVQGCHCWACYEGFV